MKILYITTVGVTMNFFCSFIRSQLDIGNQIDIATNENDGKNEVPVCYREWGCRVFHIDTSRSPISFGNIRAIKQIRDIVSKNHYDIVHCHTPLASMATRLACKELRTNGLKVIYTAHGFHFYDGAPLKNWLIYYPVEKWLSKYTDVLITINKEDYKRAKDNFYSNRIEYVPGIGIDLDKFKRNENGRQKIRKELGLDESRIMLLSVGELNDNKNHESVIRAIEKEKNITYVVVGRGDLRTRLIHLADECDVDLRLMGYRNDVADFYKAADAYILPSLREGLNVSLMEAMASSLSCLVGRIRGNIDLIDDKGGFLFDPASIEGIRKAVKNMLSLTDTERRNLGCYNMNKIRAFDLKSVKESVSKVYQR